MTAQLEDRKFQALIRRTSLRLRIHADMTKASNSSVRVRKLAPRHRPHPSPDAAKNVEHRSVLEQCSTVTVRGPCIDREH
ncbi:hypothetical protein RRG08_054405 [Elysia crispata]|uniref:Uncharacterized protein n=1 Tax=Elysia crispata TaxID=231223 RepID=A0AAE1B4L3_9GAST|nr:hypothetical protein RRG08_054405 [Elysia crispata]